MQRRRRETPLAALHRLRPVLLPESWRTVGRVVSVLFALALVAAGVATAMAG